MRVGLSLVWWVGVRFSQSYTVIFLFPTLWRQRLWFSSACSGFMGHCETSISSPQWLHWRSSGFQSNTTPSRSYWACPHFLLRTGTLYSEYFYFILFYCDLISLSPRYAFLQNHNRAATVGWPTAELCSVQTGDGLPHMPSTPLRFD